MPTTNSSAALRKRRAGGGKRILVLDTVAEVLAERGYENTRFADVSAASGVAISTLQNYFGSRADMVVEAMELATTREVDALESVAAAEHDPWARLVALVDRSLDNAYRSQQMLVEFWRSAMRDDELREFGTEVWERYRAPFLAAVCEGREQGAFTPTAGPDDVVDLVLSALAGATVFRVVHHPAPPPAGFRGVLLAQLRSMLGLGVAAR
ncbi:TetR/AcrR family transcriptional regulator [Pseudonocardia cypriaca]|uniref:TetR family transcriptional regulator n=1 Tax=Pseudonocardia cypriaca TaxID=882449 RepID=A0A543FTE7_9PSEU|nr:TetR/AcrR family transcriptional regulator [Pseudonocardia cypriaca]TQM37110.1 TetR family transcriptional regulator [Pseudonocardia cypriaca]